MSRPHTARPNSARPQSARPQPPAAIAARAELTETDHDNFDHLAGALLAAKGALGAALRGQLPGVEGVRWLHREGIAPSTRAAALTAEQWQSLFTAWSALDRAPGSGGSTSRSGGRPSTHGHAPGAQAAPRWF